MVQDNEAARRHFDFTERLHQADSIYLKEISNPSKIPAGMRFKGKSSERSMQGGMVKFFLN